MLLYHQSLRAENAYHSHLQFSRDWHELAKGAANIVEVNQSEIVDKSGWSKEFIEENLAKATKVGSIPLFLLTRKICTPQKKIV